MEDLLAQCQPLYQEKKMNKEEVVKLMMESFTNDNYNVAKQAGMNDDEINKKMSQSAPAIMFMLSNIYDNLVDKKIIN